MQKKMSKILVNSAACQILLLLLSLTSEIAADADPRCPSPRESPASSSSSSLLEDLRQPISELSWSGDESTHNLVCEWQLEPRDGRSIALVVERVKMEVAGTAAGCYDRLTVVPGGETVDAKAELCRQQQVAKTAMLATEFRLRLVTDDSVSSEGFVLRWAYVDSRQAEGIREEMRVKDSSRCQLSPTKAAADQSVLGFSPVQQLSWTGRSDTHNLRCEFRIANTPGRVTLLQVTRLSMEDGVNSECYDHLGISAASSFGSTRQLKLRLCGRVTNASLVTTDSVKLTIVTDSSEASEGFLLRWTFVTEEEAEETLRRGSWRGLDQCPSPASASNQSVFGFGPATELNWRPSQRFAPINCDLEVPSRRGFLLLLQLVTLRMEMSESECLDFLRINMTRYGNSKQPESAKICGIVRNVTIVTSQSVNLTVVSDGTGITGRFLVRWAYVRESLGEEVQRLASWNAFESCPSPKDVRLSSLHSFLFDSAARQLSWRPARISASLNCSLTIPASQPDRLLLLKIVRLRMQPEGRVKCLDYLEIGIRELNSGGRQVKRLCRPLRNVTLVTEQPVSLRLVAGFNTGSRGFLLRWMSVDKVEWMRRMASVGEDSESKPDCPQPLQVSNSSSPSSSSFILRWRSRDKPLSLACRWLIQSRTDSERLLLRLLSLNLKSSASDTVQCANSLAIESSVATANNLTLCRSAEQLIVSGKEFRLRLRVTRPQLGQEFSLTWGFYENEEEKERLMSLPFD